MNSILIKPHHFIDIIKLYGSGIDRFVPDEKMGHDFYKVANEIIDNPSIDLKLTIDGDDICKPCKKYHEQCIDPLTHIQGYTSKDVYNKTLDKRIIKLWLYLSASRNRIKGDGYGRMKNAEYALGTDDLSRDRVWCFKWNNEGNYGGYAGECW